VRAKGTVLSGASSRQAARHAERCQTLRVSDWPGVEDREAREALLADLGTSVLSWTKSLVDLLSSNAPIPDWFDDELRQAVLEARRGEASTELEALGTVVSWCMGGLAHSFLVTLDGGSQRCPTLDLQTPEGRSLGEALHEQWPDVDPTAT